MIVKCEKAWIYINVSHFTQWNRICIQFNRDNKCTEMLSLKTSHKHQSRWEIYRPEPLSPRPCGWHIFPLTRQSLACLWQYIDVNLFWHPPPQVPPPRYNFEINMQNKKCINKTAALICCPVIFHRLDGEMAVGKWRLSFGKSSIIQYIIPESIQYINKCQCKPNNTRWIYENNNGIKQKHNIV